MKNVLLPLALVALSLGNLPVLADDQAWIDGAGYCNTAARTYRVSSGDVYLVAGGDGLDTAKLAATIETGPQGKGRVVQSFSPIAGKCSLLAVSSLGGEPEQIALWTYNGPGTGNFIEKTTRFGHGQDLSSFVDRAGQQWFWLTNADGTGATEFLLKSGSGAASLTNESNVKLNSSPRSNQMVTVSATGQYLVSVGRNPAGEGSRPFVVQVFDMASVTDAVGNVPPAPVSSFPLDSFQQQAGQWRQGVAMIGQSIFLLSGDNKIDDQKVLMTYDLKGNLLNRQFLDFATDWARKLGDGEHLEPEGLEVVLTSGGPRLLLGTAAGDLGDRKFRIWSLPLEKRQ